MFCFGPCENMSSKRRENCFWKLVLCVGIAGVTLVSIGTSVILLDELDSLSQRALIAVFVLSFTLAAASSAATVWVLWQSNPWPKWPSLHRNRFSLTNAWSGMRQRVGRAVERRVSSCSSALSKKERYVVLALLFIGAIGLLVATVVADQINEQPSWADFVAPISGSLFGLAIARPLDLPLFRRSDIWWIFALGFVLSGLGGWAWLELGPAPPMSWGPFLLSLGAGISGSSFLKLLPPPAHI